MKNILLMAFMSMSMQTFAAVQFNNDISEVCKLGHECQEYKSQSLKTKDIIFDYALFLNEEVLSEKDYSEKLNYKPSEDDVIWGRFNLKSAMDFVSGHIEAQDSFDGQAGISRATAKRINILLSKMAAQNIVFGFSPNTGGSVCGVSMPGLLIIDQENQQIYDISLFGWPSC